MFILALAGMSWAQDQAGPELITPIYPYGAIPRAPSGDLPFREPRVYIYFDILKHFQTSCRVRAVQLDIGSRSSTSLSSREERPLLDRHD